MGQKWPDPTVRSHAVLVAQNEVHHWNGIGNLVLAVWLSCYIILCILDRDRFDVISRIFPDSTTSLRPGRCAVWEPEIAEINFGLILAYILLFFALLYITYINRTKFSISFHWYHSLNLQKDIRVFMPEPCHQSSHFWSIQPVLHAKHTTPYIAYTVRSGFLIGS